MQRSGSCWLLGVFVCDIRMQERQDEGHLALTERFPRFVTRAESLGTKIESHSHYCRSSYRFRETCPIIVVNGTTKARVRRRGLEAGNAGSSAMLLSTVAFEYLDDVSFETREEFAYVGHIRTRNVTDRARLGSG